ncbi:hypothetical protein [Demequina salsinemoris]|uniref:hypothetical protein n=1 Tax=Demequina salsinemoris TaxID=577470 RepID=UPI0007863824|nr:hypothetical protein [Demequina salsinemoris]
MSIVNFSHSPQGYPSFRFDLGAIATPVITLGAAAALAAGVGFAFAASSDDIAPVCDNLSPVAGVTVC